MDLLTAKQVITTPIQIIGEIIQFVKSNTVDYYKTTSLTEATKLTRVEPIAVIGRDCMTLDYAADVMHVCVNMFAGYYLQAVALTSRVGGVRVVKVLDRLNPDRDSSGFFASLESHASPAILLADSYKYRLPRVSMEGKYIDAYLKGDQVEPEANPEHVTADNHYGVFSKDIANEASNLAVGKLINVRISIDEHTTEIPVNIRLAPAAIANSSVEHMLTIKKDDNSLSERWHAWRSGRITFIKDLVLCQDMIDAHRKAMMKDETGIYQEIIRRVNNTKKYGLLGQNPSLVSASSIFIISEESAKNVERELGGKLSNIRIRNKAFENTFAMMLVVIDREWERVTFYHRGINGGTELNIRDIKAINKKSNGADIADIMRSLMQNNSPSF